MIARRQKSPFLSFHQYLVHPNNGDFFSCIGPLTARLDTRNCLRASLPTLLSSLQNGPIVANTIPNGGNTCWTRVGRCLKRGSPDIYGALEKGMVGPRQWSSFQDETDVCYMERQRLLSPAARRRPALFSLGGGWGPEAPHWWTGYHSALLFVTLKKIRCKKYY
jgi:hypothetical protein